MAAYTPILPEEDLTQAHREDRWMRVVYWLVVSAGLLLTLLTFTDYSLANTFPDWAFAITVGILSPLAFASLWLAGSGYVRSIRRLAMIPALVTGGLALLLFVVMWLPPFTIGSLLYWRDVSSEQVIQTVVSPNGRRTATAYLRGIGTYGGGNGRTYVRVARRGLSFIERDVFVDPESYANERTGDYVRWEDDGTLVVVGEPDVPPATINLGWLPL